VEAKWNFAMHDQPVNILELVKSLRDDTTGLIRDEVALAKTEIGEKIATASRNVGYLAAGALVAYAGLIFLLAALSFVLRAMFLAGDVSEPIATLLSFLIVGVIVGGVGASLVMKAINTLKKETPIPTKTVKTLEEDKEWVQRKVS
jgi:Putative Actinobacterial Holin-X, holin superfamily III